MNAERDKLITEAIGKCWHEFHNNPFPIDYCKCKKCGYITATPSLSNNKYYDTWKGFGELWEWAEKFSKIDTRIRYIMKTDNVHPERFVNALYKFLKAEQLAPSPIERVSLQDHTYECNTWSAMKCSCGYDKERE